MDKFSYVSKRPKAKEGKIIEVFCDSVYDGDTIYVSGEHSLLKRIPDNSIRLSGIDAPERGREGTDEPGAQRATSFLKDLIEGKNILIDIRTKTEGGEIKADLGLWNKGVGIIYIKSLENNKWINVNKSMLTHYYATTTHLDEMNISDKEKNEWLIAEMTGGFHEHEDEILEVAEDGRDDFLGEFDPSTNTRIGDTILPIPNENITVNKVNKSHAVSALRNGSTITGSSGHNLKQISFDFYFDGPEQINGIKKEANVELENKTIPYYYINGLRSLIAQFKLTPFLPIENENINNELDINAITLQNIVVANLPNYPDIYKVTLIAVEFNHKAYIDTLMPFNHIFDWDLFRFYYQRLLEGVDSNFDNIKLPLYKPDNNSVDFEIINMFSLQEKEDALNKMRNTLRDSAIDPVKGNTTYEEIYHDYLMIEVALKQKQKADELLERYNINKSNYQQKDTSTVRAFQNEYRSFCRQSVEQIRDVPFIHDIVGADISRVVYYYPYSTVTMSPRSLSGRDWYSYFELNLRSKSNRNLLKEITKEVIEVYKKEGQNYIPSRSGIFDYNFIIHKEVYQRMLSNMESGFEDAWTSDSSRFYLSKELFDLLKNTIIQKGEKQKEQREKTIESVTSDEWEHYEWDKIELENITVQDVSVSLANQVNSQKISMQTKPTHQYLGGKEGVVNVELITENVLDVYTLNSMFEHVKFMQLRYSNVIDRPLLKLNNNLVNIFGFYGLDLQDMNIQTVQGQPGVYQISIDLIGIYKPPEDFESLSRIHSSNIENKKRKQIDGPGILDFYHGVTDTDTKTSLKDYLKIKKHWDELSLYPDLYLPRYNELPINSSLYDSDSNKYVDPDFYALNVNNLFLENTLNVLMDETYELVGYDSEGNKEKVEINNWGQVVNDLEFEIEDTEESLSDYEKQIKEVKTLNYQTVLKNMLGNEHVDKIKTKTIDDYISATNRLEPQEIREETLGNRIAWIFSGFEGHIDAIVFEHLKRLTSQTENTLFRGEITDVLSLYFASNWHSVIIDNNVAYFPIHGESNNLVAKNNNGEYVENIDQAETLGHFDLEKSIIPSWVYKETAKYFSSLNLSVNSKDLLHYKIAKDFKFASELFQVILFDKYEEHLAFITNAEQTTDFSAVDLFTEGIRQALGQEASEWAQLTHELEEAQSSGSGIFGYFSGLEDFLHTGIMFISLGEIYGYSLEQISRGESEHFYSTLRNNFLNLERNIELPVSKDVIGNLPQVMQEIANQLVAFNKVELVKGNLSLQKDQLEIEQKKENIDNQDEIKKLEQEIEDIKNKRFQIIANSYDKKETVEINDIRLRDKKERYLSAYHDMLNYDQRGRLVRAFPSYYMMLMDEGENVFIWKLQDIFYEYNGIQEIEVVRSKENLADACMIKLSNRKQNLSDPTGGFKENRTDMDFGEYLMDTLNPFSDFDLQKQLRSEDIHSLQLQTGARIHLRMGYGSNPNQLPCVFNGVITELELGNQITFVAQNDGTQLNRPIEAGPEEHTSSNFIFSQLDTKTFQNNLYQNVKTPKRILAGRLCTTEKWRQKIIKRLSAQPTGEPLFYRNNQYNVHHMGAAYRPNFFDKLYRIPNDPEIEEYSYEIMQNIYEPGVHNETNEALFATFLYGKSIFDLLQTCAMAVPNYIGAVHPFGLRNTIFYGHPSFDLAYEYDGEIRDGEIYGDIEEKVKSYRQMHVYGSFTDIISNQLVVSEQNIQTAAVPVVTQESGDTEELDTLYLDANIYPDKQKKIYVDTTIRDRNRRTKFTDLFSPGSSDQKDVAKNYATSALKQHIQTMYDGNLIIQGDPTVKPYDYSYIADIENQMSGSFEVNTVVHHMNEKEGFISNINPDPIVSANAGFKKDLDFWLMGKKNFDHYYMPFFASRLLTNTAYGIVLQKSFPGISSLLQKAGPHALSKAAAGIKGKLPELSKIKAWMTNFIDSSHEYFLNSSKFSSKYSTLTSKINAAKAKIGLNNLGIDFKTLKVQTQNYINTSRQMAAKGIGPKAAAAQKTTVSAKTSAFIKSTIGYSMKGIAGAAKILGGPVGTVAILVAEYLVINNIRKFFRNKRDNRSVLTIMPLQHHGQEFTAGIEGHQGAVIGDEPSQLDEYLNHPVLNFILGPNEDYEIRQTIADELDVKEGTMQNLLKDQMALSGGVDVLENEINATKETQEIKTQPPHDVKETPKATDEEDFFLPARTGVTKLFDKDNPYITFANSVGDSIFAWHNSIIKEIGEHPEGSREYTVIAEGDNLTALYQGLKEVNVSEGQKIYKEQNIGNSASSFRFSVKVPSHTGHQFLDPLSLVKHKNIDIIETQNTDRKEWLKNINSFQRRYGGKKMEDVVSEGQEILQKIISSQYKWDLDEIILLDPEVTSLPSTMPNEEKELIYSSIGFFVSFEPDINKGYTKEDYFIKLIEVLQINGIKKITIYDDGLYFDSGPEGNKGIKNVSTIIDDQKISRFF